MPQAADCGSHRWRRAGLLRGLWLWTYSEPEELLVVREGFAVRMNVEASVTPLHPDSVVLPDRAVADELSTVRQHAFRHFHGDGRGLNQRRPSCSNEASSRPHTN
jgi:hypothetical protein